LDEGVEEVDVLNGNIQQLSAAHLLSVSETIVKFWTLTWTKQKYSVLYGTLTWRKFIKICSLLDPDLEEI
jgi:hypothetical protein